MARVSIYKYYEPVLFSRRVITLVTNFLLFVAVMLAGFGVCDFLITSSPGFDSYALTVKAGQLSAELQEKYEALEPETGEEAAVRELTGTKEYAELTVLRESLIRNKMHELAVVYLVLSLLYFMVLPLLLKNRVSLTEHMFSMAACMRSGNQVPFWSVLLKWAGEAVTYFNVMYIVLILTYSENSTAFFRQEFLFGVRFSAFYFLSLGMLALSFVSCAAGKKNHQTLSDLISGQLMKDIRE